MTESKLPERKVKFDWWGALTLGVALAALVLVLDKGNEWGWVSLASSLTYLTVIVFGAVFVPSRSITTSPSWT